MEENYNRHVRMLFIVFQCTHTHISRSVVAIFTLHAYFTTYSTTRLGICRLIGTFRAEHSKIELHQIEREMNCSPRREAIYHFHHPFSRQMRLMPNNTVFYFAYYEQVFTVRGIPRPQLNSPSGFDVFHPFFPNFDTLPSPHAPHTCRYERAAAS